MIFQLPKQVSTAVICALHHPLAPVSLLTVGITSLYPACLLPSSIKNSSSIPGICDEPSITGDSQSTTIQSYMIIECPTCSQRQIPTPYTYENAACHQGATERSKAEMKGDTSCVTSGLIVAPTFICNGTGNPSRDKRDETIMVGKGRRQRKGER